MSRNTVCTLFLGLLAMAFMGCEGSPCPDNQDGACLTNFTGLICNMAIPAQDPANGTCQYPGELDEVCAGNADCETGACVMDEMYCAGLCCNGACLDNPACIACRLLPFFPYVCKVPVGESCMENTDAVHFPSINSCIEGIVQPLGEPGDDCDVEDHDDCQYGLHCIEHICH